MAMMEAEAGGGGGGAPPPEASDEAEPSDAMHALINSQIEDMQKMLNVFGTAGMMKPRTLGISYAEKKAELESLYSKSASNRGDGSVMLFFEMAVQGVQWFADRMPSRDAIDLSTKYKFSDEVQSSGAMFKDALKELSIKYRGYFAMGPERTVVQNLLLCGRSCAIKNHHYKATQRLAGEPATPENDPHNSPVDNE